MASTASVALQIPQMILLSFNGAVNVDNFRIYEDIFNDKTAINPNNCSAKGTFFVSHKYTNYSAVQASLVLFALYLKVNLSAIRTMSGLLASPCS